jgi:hypothetical protein
MYEKNNNLFEKNLNSKSIHYYEDYIRAKLLSNKKINKIEIIILARILWGRLTNSCKCLSGKLDSRHSKAQMITLLCIVYYLSREIYNSKKILSKDLYKLYNYHCHKIDEYLKTNSIDILDEKNKKYYIFCSKSKEYCQKILNINITESILIEKKNKILLTINIPEIDKIELNNKILTYIKNLKIDDFIEN